MSDGFDAANWKLKVARAPGDTLLITLDEIKALPKTEIVFEFNPGFDLLQAADDLVPAGIPCGSLHNQLQTGALAIQIKVQETPATAGPALNIPIAARGAAFGDLNNDGQIDVVIGILDGPPLVLRNMGTRNHWLGVSLSGSKSNRNGIGARVTVTESGGRKQIFDVTNAGSYLSSNDPRIVVGLGAATGVRSVEVRWPSGRVQTLANPGIDRYIPIKEAETK